MKQYKMNVVDELVKRAESDRIVPLKSAANEAGVERLISEEALEVLSKASRRTGYRIVRMVKKGYESVWECGALIAPEIEF